MKSTSSINAALSNTFRVVNASTNEFNIYSSNFSSLKRSLPARPRSSECVMNVSPPKAHAVPGTVTGYAEKKAETTYPSLQPGTVVATGPNALNISGEPDTSYVAKIARLAHEIDPALLKYITDATAHVLNLQLKLQGLQVLLKKHCPDNCPSPRTMFESAVQKGDVKMLGKTHQVVNVLLSIYVQEHAILKQESAMNQFVLDYYKTRATAATAATVATVADESAGEEGTAGNHVRDDKGEILGIIKLAQHSNAYIQQKQSDMEQRIFGARHILSIINEIGMDPDRVVRVADASKPNDMTALSKKFSPSASSGDQSTLRADKEASFVNAALGIKVSDPAPVVLDTVDSERFTLMRIATAILHSNPLSLKATLEEMPEERKLGFDLFTAIRYALYDRNLIAFNMLLEHGGVDLYQTDHDGNTLTTLAKAKGKDFYLCVLAHQLLKCEAQNKASGGATQEPPHVVRDSGSHRGAVHNTSRAKTTTVYDTLRECLAQARRESTVSRGEQEWDIADFVLRRSIFSADDLFVLQTLAQEDNISGIQYYLQSGFYPDMKDKDHPGLVEMIHKKIGGTQHNLMRLISELEASCKDAKKYAKTSGTLTLHQRAEIAKFRDTLTYQLGQYRVVASKKSRMLALWNDLSKAYALHCIKSSVFLPEKWAKPGHLDIGAVEKHIEVLNAKLDSVKSNEVAREPVHAVSSKTLEVASKTRKKPKAAKAKTASTTASASQARNRKLGIEAQPSIQVRAAEVQHKRQTEPFSPPAVVSTGESLAALVVSSEPADVVSIMTAELPRDDGRLAAGDAFSSQPEDMAVAGVPSASVTHAADNTEPGPQQEFVFGDRVWQRDELLAHLDALTAQNSQTEHHLIDQLNDASKENELLEIMGRILESEIAEGRRRISSVMGNTSLAYSVDGLSDSLKTYAAVQRKKAEQDSIAMNLSFTRADLQRNNAELYKYREALFASLP